MNKPILHVIIWLLIIQIIFNLSGIYYSLGEENFIDDAIIMIPCMVGLFYWNGYFLIPRFFNKKSWWKYILFVILSVFSLLGIGMFIYNIFLEKGYDSNGDMIDFVDSLLLFDLLILGVSSSLGIAKFAFRNASEKKIAEEKQRKSEMKYLNSQVNPHFLFNTLNSIYALSTEEDAPQTTESILQLSEIMRYPLNEGTRAQVGLEKEIQFLKDYISLQKIRLGEDYPIDFEIKGKINNLKIAPLIFIPFIENAFKYGVSQKGKNPINILFEINNNDISFNCENKIITQNNITSHGIGTKNVISRLELLYPNKYNLNVEEKNENYKINLMISL